MTYGNKYAKCICNFNSVPSISNAGDLDRV